LINVAEKVPWPLVSFESAGITTWVEVSLLLSGQCAIGRDRVTELVLGDDARVERLPGGHGGRHGELEIMDDRLAA